MFTLRCTASLLARMKVRPELGTPAPPTTVLGDWYATTCTIDRQPLVVAVSARSLVPIVMRGAPFTTVAKRLPAALRAVLVELGLPEATIAAELAEMNDVAVAKTNDRRIVGTLVDFVNMLPYHEPVEPYLEAAIKLADAPVVSMLGGEDSGHATRRLLGDPTAPLPDWARPRTQLH